MNKLTIKDLLASCDDFSPVVESDFTREISSVYCCDLLSIVMGQAPADCGWVTVMGNVNGVAVAVLADMAVMIVAENAAIDDIAINRAEMQGVNILKTKLPIFDAALILHKALS